MPPKISKEKKVLIKPDGKPDQNYSEATGRRKTAIARVRLWRKHDNLPATFEINGRPLEKYFFTQILKKTVADAFDKTKAENKYNLEARIKGGGINAQAEALRHAISRALIKDVPDLRKKLKKAGYLKRDPRAKERRKFGLKKARKAPQWSKR